MNSHLFKLVVSLKPFQGGKIKKKYVTNKKILYYF